MNTIILILLILIAALFGIARIFLFLVEVEGWSMYPIYHHKDRLLAIRFWPPRWLRRNQVVVWELLSTVPEAFKPEKIGPELFVKRIVGLAEDELTVPVVMPPESLDVTTTLVKRMRTWYVPVGHCFVKGDSLGFDSTVIGPIPLHCIRGVVLTRLSRINHELTTPPEYLILKRTSKP